MLKVARSRSFDALNQSQDNGYDREKDARTTHPRRNRETRNMHSASTNCKFLELGAHPDRCGCLFARQQSLPARRRASRAETLAGLHEVQRHQAVPVLDSVDPPVRDSVDPPVPVLDPVGPPVSMLAAPLEGGAN